LVDSASKALANVTLQVSVPPGAYAPATIKTDATGTATLNPQLGRATGSYKFTVSVATYTASFTATAVAPATGALFDLVNQTHTAVSGATPGGPAPTFATYYYVPSVVAASDGTLYFDDYASVYSISPAGVLTRIAGTGTYGNSSSDTGPATSIQLYLPQGLALDEANGYLYIADYDSQKVRRVYLTGTAAGSMDLLAGGGSAGSPDYGDGGSGDQATLSNPQQVSVDSSGNVYIGDSGHNRIRKVDTNGTITAYVSLYQTNLNTSPGAQTCSVSLTFDGCSTNCGVTFDAKGQAFITGNFCGSQVPGTSTYNSGNGVARVEKDGSLTLVAGGSSSSATGDNLQATSAYFQSVPSIAFDKGGNLFASIQSANKVRRIDAATGVITTVAGSGTAGYKGDYADAATGANAEFNAPTDLAFDPSGNLYVADYNDYTLRAIWGVGSATANTIAMAISNGNNQSANVDALLSPPLAVKITSGAGATAVSGATVTWTALTAGSGFSASSPTVATSQSNAQGTASISGRAGLSTGTYQFTASYRDIHGNQATGSPATFSVTATAPTTGNIFTIVNTSHTSGTTSATLPGTFAQTGAAGGIAVGANGNMYIGENCQVSVLTPKGVYSPLVGNGQCASGSVGDGGNASDARLYGVENLALDEVTDPTNRILYINDYNNARIRAVTLDENPPQINTFVGYTSGGTAPGSPDYGVPGPGTGVNLTQGYGMAFNPGDKSLYYIEAGHQRILKIDADTKSATYGNVTVLLTTTTVCTGAINIYYLSSGQSQIAWASGNVAYISGYLCGTDTSSNFAYGIVKYVAATKAITHIAGTYSTGSQAEGATALNTYFPALGGIAIGPGGNSLYVTTENYNSIREITLTGTPVVNTIAGSTGSAAAYSGDYVPALTASFNTPSQLAFSGSHLIVTDYSNYAFREIW
jgi:sugar lactone lactonase YvrE